MQWVTMQIRDLEAKILESISIEELWKHTENIAGWVRTAGSFDEAKAFDYIENILRGYGAKVEAYEFDSLIGLPETASLKVVSPEAKSLDCITHALVPSTPPDGIEAEVVYVGRGNRSSYGGKMDVRGKIVLIDGLGSPYRARLAEDKGSIAQIFINDEYTREFAISTVWGTPTPETASLLQKTPCISVSGGVGDYLKEKLSQGPIRVRMKSRSWKGWKKIPALTAEIKGVNDPEQFVLLSGHVDSWHHGAMDNAGANATMMELLRILSGHAQQLKRSLRVAFWSGHSQGRYSGSTWYADNFWEDLHENCVAHVNIDSTGGQGANILTEAETMAETRTFAHGVIKQLTGQELKVIRVGRFGDQSFWGCGVPSLFVSLSVQPQEAQRGGFGGGLGWWWHTKEDTIDKLDRHNLLRDAKIYGLLVTRLCALPVLPFDYNSTAEEILNILGEFQQRAKGVFDLGRCLERAGLLKEEVRHFGDHINRILKNREAMEDEHVEKAFDIINKALMELGRILIPINYTGVDPFDQDLAVPLRPIPVLWPVTGLNSMDPERDDFHFLFTRLVRESNKVCHTLKQAAMKTGEACRELKMF